MDELSSKHDALDEWDYLQHTLLNPIFLSRISHTAPQSRRTCIEGEIIQRTKGCAHIWWEPYIAGSAADDSQLFELRYQCDFYGILELASGYLICARLPTIPQHFANLCTLLIAWSKQEAFLQQQLKQLPLRMRTKVNLTRRERDVLQGLVRGESEHEMASRLNIEEATVHTHVQRLYRRLDVHGAQEAIALAFELKLVDWLELP